MSRSRKPEVEYIQIAGPLPVEISGDLFVAWVGHLANTNLGLPQWGGGRDVSGQTHTFSLTDVSSFTIARSDRGFRLTTIDGLARETVAKLLDEAKQLAEAANWGEGVVYRTTMSTDDFKIDQFDMLHFMRRLGDQVGIVGKRRLSDAVLLDFNQPATGTGLFVPKTEIEVTLFIPGPYKCELSDRVAAGVSDLVAAICALALGTPVKRFPMLSFLRGDDRKLAEESRRDPQILGLARDSVSLDIIGEFQGIGGLDGFMKVRNSLITYHAALEQSNADVVVMLMVTAIEALVTPNQSWAKDGRTTQRFISAVISVVPGAVDELLEHANCEEAFGYRQRGGTNRRRIDLLSRIYELRSNPSHRGLSASGASFMSAMADSGSMRAALLSDLARAMILAFVQAPRSFLTGHPVIDPPKVAA